MILANQGPAVVFAIGQTVDSVDVAHGRVVFVRKTVARQGDEKGKLAGFMEALVAGGGRGS